MKRKPISRRKPNELPSEVEALKAMVMELLDGNAYLKRMLFGRRSEKLQDDPQQELLFGSAEGGESREEEQEEGAAEEDQESVPRRRRTRHRGRRPLPDHLPRCTHEIHPPAEELTCPCCGEHKTVFGQAVTEELDVVPAKFFVNRYVRYKYACRRCEGYVSVGSLPPRPMDKGIPGPGFLAHLITSKYADHLPLYRQQQIYRRAGLELPRSTMCGWVSYAAFLSIDNNHSERQIKQLVIGRKNWLFAGSEGGAENAAILFSPIVSCKLAGVDPFAYLRDVLMRIHTHPPERLQDLMPREWKTNSEPPPLPRLTPPHRASGRTPLAPRPPPPSPDGPMPFVERLRCCCSRFRTHRGHRWYCSRR